MRKWVWDIFHCFHYEKSWWNACGSIPHVIDVDKGRQTKQFEGGEY